MSKWATAMAAAIAMTAVVGCGSGANASTVTLTEVGSSLLYPLFQQAWLGAYQRVAPRVSIDAAAGGSGKGIADAIAGNAQIGASDAYLPPMEMKANPTVLNIPLAISAQQIMYNLPGVKGHLKLSGGVLAQIYTGRITRWNDPSIQRLNPGVALPNEKIVPIYRSDSSGDSFLFTSFLSAASSVWAHTTGFSTTPSWPSVLGSVGANGNNGVVQALVSNRGSIGYVGISWLGTATKEGLVDADLQNRDGNFVLPTLDNIEAAAHAQVNRTPANEAVSLVYGPGANAYPLINYEYAIVNTTQSDAQMAAALKNFLEWAISPTGGNTERYLRQVHFLPLPSQIQLLSQAQIDKIGR